MSQESEKERQNAARIKDEGLKEEKDESLV